VECQLAKMQKASPVRGWLWQLLVTLGALHA
jgi:hypothetical protein